MTFEERLSAFLALGQQIHQLTPDELNELAYRAQAENAWFTRDNIIRAFEGIDFMLEKERMKKWLAPYGNPEPSIPKIIGVIMAGNIPLVGFHDLMCVLLSGHFAAIKPSKVDTFLIQKIVDWLVELEPRFKKNIDLRERLTAIDALIATGSDNTARYFEYYFRDHPKIIRKNRVSIAILKGTETENELSQLGKDIFWYFGLGCRNVSKIFIPRDYDPKNFFEAIQPFENILDAHKYQNNYDYYKSIFLINGTPHLDNGFLLWVPSKDLVSPLSVVYVEEYDDEITLIRTTESQKEKIQAILGSGHLPFGSAQCPSPWEYADDVDTLHFLNSL